MPTTVEDWAAFLRRYRSDASQLFEREGWELDDDRWRNFAPAPLADISATEKRLGVTLPESLRNFYLTCDGWPADGWVNPAINRLTELDWLRMQNPGLYQLVAETERSTWKNRADDDPDLLAHRDEQGTRVMRTLAITFDHNDQEAILLDPEDDWRLGSWAHWNPAMSWTDGSFSEYMVERLERLLEDWN